MGVSDHLPKGQRRGAAAVERLANAYRDVFKGEAGEIVLADLAHQSGFYAVSPPGSPEATLREAEGARRLFFRIQKFVALTDAEIVAIEAAARRERIASSEEGEI